MANLRSLLAAATTVGANYLQGTQARDERTRMAGLQEREVGLREHAEARLGGAQAAREKEVQDRLAASERQQTRQQMQWFINLQLNSLMQEAQLLARFGDQDERLRRMQLDTLRWKAQNSFMPADQFDQQMMAIFEADAPAVAESYHQALSGIMSMAARNLNLPWPPPALPTPGGPEGVPAPPGEPAQPQPTSAEVPSYPHVMGGGIAAGAPTGTPAPAQTEPPVSLAAAGEAGGASAAGGPPPTSGATQELPAETPENWLRYALGVGPAPAAPDYMGARTAKTPTPEAWEQAQIEAAWQAPAAATDAVQRRALRKEIVWASQGVAAGDPRRDDPRIQAGVAAAAAAPTLSKIPDTFRQGMADYDRRQREARSEQRADVRLGMSVARGSGGGSRGSSGGGGGERGETYYRSLALRGVTTPDMPAEWKQVAERNAPGGKSETSSKEDIAAAVKVFGDYRAARKAADKVGEILTVSGKGADTYWHNRLAWAAETLLRVGRDPAREFFGIEASKHGPRGGRNWLQEAKHRLSASKAKPTTSSKVAKSNNPFK